MSNHTILTHVYIVGQSDRFVITRKYETNWPVARRLAWLLCILELNIIPIHRCHVRKNEWNTDSFREIIAILFDTVSPSFLMFGIKYRENQFITNLNIHHPDNSNRKQVDTLNKTYSCVYIWKRSLNSKTLQFVETNYTADWRRA